MSPEIITLLLFGCLFTLVFIGMPVSFALGSTAMLLCFFHGAPHHFTLLSLKLGELVIRMSLLRYLFLFLWL